MNAQPQYQPPYTSRYLEPEAFDLWIALDSHADAPNRVWAVTGEPGNGKSTLMKRLRDRHLLQSGPQSTLVFWLDLATIYRDAKLWQESLHNWLIQIDAEARLQLTQLALLPVAQDVQTRCQLFAGNLNTVCAWAKIVVVLLIDGWDDVDPNPPLHSEQPSVRSDIETAIIGSFLDYLGAHVRIVVASRAFMKTFGTTKVRHAVDVMPLGILPDPG